MKNVKWLTILFALPVFVGVGTFVYATEVTRNVSFSGYYGDMSKGEFLNKTVDLPWPCVSGDSATAIARLNRGSAELQYSGSLTYNYTPSMAHAGTTLISLNFNPIGGTIRSEMGFWASIAHNDASEHTSLSFNYDDYYRVINNTFKDFGVESSASTPYTFPGVEISKFGVGAGVTLGGTAWVEYTPEYIYSTLYYRHVGDMGFKTAYVELTGSAKTIGLNLDRPGDWEFVLAPLNLQSVVNTALTVRPEIYGIYALIPPGKFTAWTGESTPKMDFPEMDFAIPETGTPLLPFTIHVGDGTVTVPEPSTIVLLGCALAGLIRFKRKIG